MWRSVQKLNHGNVETEELTARTLRARDPAPAPWRAADVAASFAVLKGRERPWLPLLVVLVLVTSPAVVPAIVPAITSRGMFYIATVVAFLLLSLWRLRHLRHVRELRLTCPLCNDEQTAALLHEGRCPRCDAWLIHPNELQPSPPPRITSGSPLRNAVGVVVLISLTVWGGYHAVRIVRANRADCLRRYAAARTAADTSRVDALASCRSVRARPT